MDASGVADSTDWLGTPLAGLAPLESSLRCQVCKEILSTPMITSCSHTFCSLCIRRYLNQEGKCPSCTKPDQEMKLRNNWAVQEFVEIWSKNRTEIYNFATTANTRQEFGQEERPKKRRRTAAEPVVVQKSGLEERRSTRSQSRRVASQTSVSASQTLPSTQEEIGDSESGSVYGDSPRVDRNPPHPATEVHDGLVACPNCNRRLREALINSHLDKCLQGLASPTPPPPRAASARAKASSPEPQIQAGTIAYTTSKLTPNTAARLPTINYSLLTEAAMRKKLKELGIPNHGNKELMRKRHAEWVSLWNANCDNRMPVGKGKLLRDLDIWERNFGKDERQRQGAGGSGVMEKEFDREGYMEKKKDDFEDLIRKARETRAKKQAPATEAEVEVSTTESTTLAESCDNIDAAPALSAANDADVKMGENTPNGNAAATPAQMLVPSTPPRSLSQTNGLHSIQPQPLQDRIDLTSPPTATDKGADSGKAPQGTNQEQEPSHSQRLSQTV